MITKVLCDITARKYFNCTIVEFITCRDIGPRRIDRISRMLNTYMPRKMFAEKVTVESNDGKDPRTSSVFDKVSIGKSNQNIIIGVNIY